MKKTITLILAALLVFACAAIMPAAAEPKHENYLHGEEGYYNIADELPDFRMRSQDAGDCWIYSACAGMETTFARRSGTYITLDPSSILNAVYAKQGTKEDGFLLKLWASARNIGGWQWIVTESLSNGFGDHLVIDSTVIIDNKDRDEIKRIIRERGGISADVLDNDAKQGYFDGYYTMNDTKGTWFDHAVTILGWDDHFPKDYFREPAEEDGAWICYNSNATLTGYYYISYCTPINNLISQSMTDRYTAVGSYDAGNEQDRYIRTGDQTTTANVFSRAGTLAAVGTYNDFDSQEITISVYDSTFTNILYTQEAVLDYHGYHTVELNTPVTVDGCAVAVTYSKGAPVEGETIDYDPVVYTTVSQSGQSYVLIDTWRDLTDESVKAELGIDFVPNNCCIKALYTE
ncbi:MAG: lectin like domain-containing protein [Clostridia bacterium]|nr:lectin like domain-containing protein [Clostridia bacterium]